MSRFSHDPRKQHFNLSREFSSTENTKIKFSRGASENIVGFSDADWRGDIDDRWSCIVYISKKNDGAISWAIKRQITVALSS